MLKNIINKAKKFESLTKKIIKYGFIFSFILSITSSIILFTYINFYSTPELYYIGLSLFKTSLTFAVEFIICGFAIDTIKKQLI